MFYKDDGGLLLIFVVLVFLISLFLIVVNITRIKKVFFKVAKSKKGQILTYRFIRFYIKNRRVIWYLLFGFCTLLISILSKNFFHYAFNFEHPYIAAEIAWFLSTMFAFFANKFVVFESYERSRTLIFYELLSFFGSRALSLFFDIIFIAIFVEILGLHYGTIALISSFIQIIINYFAARYLVFNERIKKLFEPKPVEKTQKTLIVKEDDFIPSFSKEDEFVKYLETEEK